MPHPVMAAILPAVLGLTLSLGESGDPGTYCLGAVKELVYLEDLGRRPQLEAWAVGEERTRACPTGGLVGGQTSQGQFWEESCQRVFCDDRASPCLRLSIAGGR